MMGMEMMMISCDDGLLFVGDDRDKDDSYCWCDGCLKGLWVCGCTDWSIRCCLCGEENGLVGGYLGGLLSEDDEKI